MDINENDQKCFYRLNEQVIDNECSMARDQFAAERNFLSWVKLAMTIIASAVIIFRDFNNNSNANIGLANLSTVYFFALSLSLIIISTVYVIKAQQSLATEKKPLGLFIPLFLQVVGCVGAVSLIFILAINYYKLIQ
ncbi:hypothetical protein BX667DRAFT_498415 [Coemansia mojavensis]|nr:hypothetical protein BX667DRAFT_498415 [Coemansia mojavensis]